MFICCGTVVLSRIVLSVHMPLVPVFCFIVAHFSLVSIAPLQSSGCANVMRPQIRGDSDRAVGQWAIITNHI
jgi:hypothetical protein